MQNASEIMGSKEIDKLSQLLKVYDEKKNNYIDVIKQIKYLYTLAPKENILTKIETLRLAFKENDGKKFKQILDEIASFFKTKETPYTPINDVFISAYNSQVNKTGISTLCTELDKAIGGLLPGNICTIAGITGSMKTTYAVNLCYNAVRKGKNVCYMSLEETPLQLYSKILSRSSIDCNKPLLTKQVVQNKLDDKEKQTLETVIYPYFEKLKGTFYILGEKDLINYDTYEIEMKLEELDALIKDKSREKQNGENHGIDILVVDHIQLLKYSDNSKDEYKLVNKYVNFFRRLSLSFSDDNREILVIILSQINREGITYAKSHEGAYLLQHVAEASEIERASSYILTVFTNADQQITKLLQIGVLKLRNAQIPSSTFQVYADGAYYHVGDIIPEQQDYLVDALFEPEPNTDKTPDSTISTNKIDESLRHIMEGGPF